MTESCVKLIAEEFCQFLQACGMDYRLSVSKWAIDDDGQLDTASVVNCIHKSAMPVVKRGLAPRLANALINLERVIRDERARRSCDTNRSD